MSSKIGATEVSVAVVVSAVSTFDGCEATGGSAVSSDEAGVGDEVADSEVAVVSSVSVGVVALSEEKLLH
jgi:hypothetical protein